VTASQAALDRRFMQVALAVARRGLGSTSPNPSVGAVIVDEATGEVIARGWTQNGGRPHAEKEALRRAGERARGQTMYITLEPCAHTGRVPTCADAMLSAGLKRVVCAIADPNPIIAGRGFDQLRDAGVEVVTGCEAEAAHWLALGHILRQIEGRPFVQLKMALDRTYAVAAGNGQPVWVTSPEARNYAHLLRKEADAILVGAGTMIADDPELTCRLPGLAGHSPIRVIVSGKKSLPANIKMAIGGPKTLVMTTKDARGAMMAGAHVEEIEVAADSKGWPETAAICTALGKRGITRLLVEGGPRTWHAFLDAGLADEVIVAVAPHKADGPMIQVIEGDAAAFFARHGLKLVEQRQIGPDRLHVYRRETRA
jgi:diaminohydroxyphosphoribosylaminopyrimidine deaminase / 5-amino-6-(5-phosphoribosylamino)uracil reductase